MVNLLQRSGTLIVFVLGMAAQAAWGQIVQGNQAAANQPVEKTSVAAPATGQDSSAGQRARLIQNPKKDDGLPPFALTDQQGAIQRYVEPVDGIDLQPYVGQVVIVQHDTGRTLLASQLVLPTPDRAVVPTASADTSIPAAHQDAAVQSVAFEEVHPDLAESGVAPETMPSPPEWAEQGQLLDEDPAFAPVYIDGPHGTSFGGHYGGSNYGCCAHCDGGNHCSHCPRTSRYRDRGLFAGLFDDSCRPEGCAPGARGRFYVRGEYLLWNFDGMNVPPLVVQGPVIDPDTGVIGDEILDANQVLYGNGEILDGTYSGSRLTFGWYQDPCGLWAFEADVLGFGTRSDGFFVRGDILEPDGTDPPTGSFEGQIGIGRPFFRVPQRIVDDELESLIAIEDVVFTDIGGSVAVHVHSDFNSFGLRFRHNLCCASHCQTGCGDCCGPVGCGSDCGDSCGRSGYGTRRIDVSFGARFAHLDEGISIIEDLEDRNGDDFLLLDSFGTENQFAGAEIGFNWEWEYCRWRLDLLSRLAVGNTRQRVAVNGSTSFNNGTPVPGGLLAQQGTNIGGRETDKLTVLPELGLNMGYQLTANLHFTLGYTFMYWSSVARPGDQIDLDVNPALIPIDNVEPATATALDRPRPFLNQTDFFAHGLNVGLEYRR